MAKRAPEVGAKIAAAQRARHAANRAIPQDSRKCTACDQVKPASDFGRYAATTHSAGRLRARCHACESMYCQLSYIRHRELDPVNYWARFALNRSKIRARELGIPHNLTKQHLKDILTPKCPYCDRHMVLREVAGSLSYVATLDQILPRGGYTVDNIIVCCSRCNTLKDNATLEELQKLVAGLARVITERQLDEPKLHVT